MKTRNRFILAGLISTLLLPHVASAQVPNLVSYQGRVAVGTANFEGTGQFKFALVNAAGTTVYWSNAADTTPADGVPDTAVSLPVSKGLYSALLGDTSIANMATIPASVWTNADVRLRVWFDDGVNGNQLLTPDQRIAPNSYLADGSVSTAKIATGAVDSPQVAGSAITSAKLASGAVTSAKLANNLTLGGTTTGTFSGSGAALTNLAAANLTGALPPLDASALTNLNGANLTANSVGNSQLADGAVTAAKLGADVGLWNVSGADVFRSVGKVGIGTNSVLGRELQVDGTAPAILIGSESFGRTSLLMGVTANSGGYSIIQSVSSAGGLIGALSLQPNGGDVGIGTDTPAAKLEISDGTASLQFRPGELNGIASAGDVTLEIPGNQTIGIWDSLKVHSDLIVGGDYYGLGHMWLHAYEGDGVSGTAFLQARDNSGTSSIGLQLRSQNAGSWLDALKIEPDGKVGIGTITPTSKLTVNGEIETLTGGVKFPDGSVQTKAAPGTGATSQFLSIGPGGFIATDSNNRVVSNFFDGTWATGGELIAAVQLPSGAEVLSMTAYVHDTSATANLNVRLVRKINTGANTNGTTFDFDVAAGTVGYFNQTQAGSHIIDGTRGYFLRVFPVGGTWPGNNTLAVNNVVIEWRMP